MSGVALDTPLAEALSSVVHAKITASGWGEGDDTSLAEYIVLMLANGKTQEQITSELQNDLLEGVDGIPEFTQWLLHQVDVLIKGPIGATNTVSQPMDQSMAQSIPEYSEQDGDAAVDDVPAAYDADMGDSAPDNAPRGPKGSHGGRPGGRGGRMMGQMSKAMDRSGDSALHRVRGQGGINSHVRGAPKGPRNIQTRDIRPSMQKALNGMTTSAGGQQTPNPMMANAQQGQGQNMQMSMSPQQQMEFMAMMEQQARMMAQFIPGMVQPAVNPAFPQNGGQQQNGQGRSLFDRVERGGGRGGRGRGRGGFQNGASRNTYTNGAPAEPSTENKTDEAPSSSMEVEQSSQPTKPGDPATTMCRFNTRCINADCPYVHQSPAAPQGVTVDMTDTCQFGVACKNSRCVGKHPSPALIKAHQAEALCKFYPNCTNPNCGFKHPTAPLCRNGADCKDADCKFTHIQTPCRFKPCYNAKCPYKHEEGQKAGAATGHVWTKDQQQHVSERKFVTEGEEELIKPEDEVEMENSTAEAQPEGVIT